MKWTDVSHVERNQGVKQAMSRKTAAPIERDDMLDVLDSYRERYGRGGRRRSHSVHMRCRGVQRGHRHGCCGRRIGSTGLKRFLWLRHWPRPGGYGSLVYLCEWA